MIFVGATFIADNIKTGPFQNPGLYQKVIRAHALSNSVIDILEYFSLE